MLKYWKKIFDSGNPESVYVREAKTEEKSSRRGVENGQNAVLVICELKSFQSYVKSQWGFIDQ